MLKRLRPLDRVLLFTLVPLWAICFGLSLLTALRDDHISHVVLSAPAGMADYPTVAGFRPFLVVEPGLHVGDKLLRVGRIDLRGMSPFAFQVEVLSATQSEPRVPAVFERGAQRGETRLPVGPYGLVIWPQLPVSLALAGVAILILTRARPTPMTRAVFSGSMCVALFFASHFAGSHAVTYASYAVGAIALALLGPLAIQASQRFPLDAPPENAWARLGPWAFAPLGLLNSSVLFGTPFAIRPQVGYPLLFASFLLLGVVALATAADRYRRADPIGRRQVKWVIFGLYAGSLPALVAFALAAIEPRSTRLAFYSIAFFAIFPFCLLIGIVRYNLFDIDRLISATASYSILGVVVLAGLLAGVPAVAQAASTASGLVLTPSSFPSGALWRRRSIVSWRTYLPSQTQGVLRCSSVSSWMRSSVPRAAWSTRGLVQASSRSSPEGKQFPQQ
jgi:hypothetical protein